MDKDIIMPTTVIHTLRSTAPNSALTRSSNVVTVTYLLNAINIKVGDTIVVSGVVPSSFNGKFTVTGTPTSNSYTYSQTGSDESSTTHGTSGGDYSLMSDWENAQDGNLVTADEIRVLECYNDWPDGLENSCTMATWTTDATRYPIIRAAANHGHGGLMGNGFKMKANGRVLDIQADYVVVEDIEMEHTGTSITTPVDISRTNCLINRCIITCPNASRSSTYYVVSSSSASANSTIRNCLIYSANGRGTGTMYCNMYNNTIICDTYGIFTSATNSPIYKNNLIYLTGTQGTAILGSGTGNESYNATSDSTATGVGAVTGITSTVFQDFANDDFRPVEASAVDGAGEDLSAFFTDDITGATR